MVQCRISRHGATPVGVGPDRVRWTRHWRTRGAPAYASQQMRGPAHRRSRPGRSSRKSCTGSSPLRARAARS